MDADTNAGFVIWQIGCAGGDVATIPLKEPAPRTTGRIMGSKVECPRSMCLLYPISDQCQVFPARPKRFGPNCDGQVDPMATLRVGHATHEFGPLLTNAAVLSEEGDYQDVVGDVGAGGGAVASEDEDYA